MTRTAGPGEPVARRRRAGGRCAWPRRFPLPLNPGSPAPWHPAKGPGGGAALPPRGGSSASGGPATAKPAGRPTRPPHRAFPHPRRPPATPEPRQRSWPRWPARRQRPLRPSDRPALSGAHSWPAGSEPGAPGRFYPVAGAHRRPAHDLDGSDSDTSGKPLPGSTPDPVVSNASGPRSQQSISMLPNVCT